MAAPALAEPAVPTWQTGVTLPVARCRPGHFDTADGLISNAAAMARMLSEGERHFQFRFKVHRLDGVGHSGQGSWPMVRAIGQLLGRWPGPRSFLTETIFISIYLF
jgi:hypothetical protein